MLNALLLRLEEDRIAVALVAATAICVCAASGLLHGMPFPRYHDDYGYLLDADTFLHGRLSNPTHPLWPHFETMMVLHTPRYISKYPVGQGALFAIGRLLGHPIAGEWIATVLACAAIWWALRVWTTPALALIGGIAVAVHPTMLGWVESFHGGQLAALGGALMLGAAGRLRIAPSWQMSAVVGAGADVLTISRPYEGLIFCVGIGLLLLRREILRVAWAGALVLVLGLGFNAVRDDKITGNPLLLPYSLYEQRYDPVPNFVWETARPVPHYGNIEMEDIYVNWYLAYYNRVHASGGMARHFANTVRDIFNALVGPGNIRGTRWIYLLLLVGLVPAILQDPQTRAIAGVVAVFAFAPFSLVWWMQDHYLSVGTAAAACLVMLAIRRLPPLLAAALLIVFFANAGLMWIAASTPDASYETKRRRIAETVLAKGGKHLIVVAPEVREMVFNGADLDGAPVVWARDLGDNAALLAYYRDRTIWRLSRVGLRRY